MTHAEVLDLFNAASIPRDFVSVPRFRGLPEGYEVLHVHNDFGRNGFVFTLYHPSWPEVEEGHVIPEVCPRGDYSDLFGRRVTTDEVSRRKAG